MDVKKIGLISLFILFFILSISSIHAHDLDNSTELNSKIQDVSIISDDGNSSGNLIDNNYYKWVLDKNGDIVIVPSNHTSADYSVVFNQKNGTDLRNRTSEDINLNQSFPPISGPSDMINLWKEYSNNPWGFDGKYKTLPDHISINWENDNSCNKPYSKEFIDFMNFVNANKVKPSSIESGDINVFYSKNNIYAVKILNPISDSVGKGINVTFVFNGKRINVKTDENGSASFKFNCQPGSYIVKIHAGNITSKNKITVKSLFNTKNIVKIYKKSSRFTIKIIKQKGKSISNQIVKISFNGKNYKIKTNSKGIAKFNIPKNLKIGKYVIKTSYNGCSVKNKITVKR